MITMVLERLSQVLAGLGIDAATEENACRRLGIQTTASNAEVDDACERLFLRHPPQRGITEELVADLIIIAIIQAARQNSR